MLDRICRRIPRCRRGRGRYAALAAAALALSGCGGPSEDLGALGVGGVVGAATGNPAIGIAAGVGTRFALQEAFLYSERSFYGSMQDSIAAAGGDTAIGEVAAWTFEGPLDLGDSRGRVETVRTFGRRLRCKEIIFTVEPLPELPEDEADPGTRSRPVPPVDPTSPLPPNAEVFTTSICRTPDGWSWAQARPSTTRWGGLQ